MLDATGVYVGLAGRCGLFRQTVRDERLLDILEAILGPNVEFLSDKVVFKDTERHVASPWHQDWPYWEGTHKISVWVALDDATPGNGCLKLLPGWHRGSVIHDGDMSDGAGFGHRIRPETVDESVAITAPVEAGGAVFFHDLTMHSSHPNTERRERWTWVPTYRDAQADDSTLFVCRRQCRCARRRERVSDQEKCAKGPLKRLETCVRWARFLLRDDQHNPVN